MKRLLSSFLVVFILSAWNVEALVDYTKPTKDEIEAAAKACMETGKSEDETKYTCPEGGAFQKWNNKTLNQQVYLCAAKMALSFSSIDESAKKWMAELQNQRNPDFNVWSADIDTTFGELNDTYYSVCKTSNWTISDKDGNVSCAFMYDFFPESTCSNLARKKADAWRNAWYILAAKWIAKNAQNDKDVFIDQKKTKYSELVNKWNNYKRIVANAVAKMTAYVRSPVK